MRWHRDAYERQLELAEHRLTLTVPADLRATVLEHIERVIHREASNPARELMPALAAHGEKVELNPATDVVRGSIGDVAWKRALIDSLARCAKA